MKVWAKTEEFSEGKFLVVRRDGTTPSWPHFVMGARDPAVPLALVRYADQAIACGMDPEFAASVVDVAEDFKRYRAENGDGDPDAAPHRKDDPLVLAMMRHEIDVRDLIQIARAAIDFTLDGENAGVDEIHELETAVANILARTNSR